MSWDIEAWAALVRRWTPSMPAPEPVVAAPDPDDWANPTPEEWASVAGRTPVVLPRCGLPFLAEHEEAEDVVLAQLAELDSWWMACQVRFAPSVEEAADVA